MRNFLFCSAIHSLTPSLFFFWLIGPLWRGDPAAVLLTHLVPALKCVKANKLSDVAMEEARAKTWFQTTPVGVFPSWPALILSVYKSAISCHVKMITMRLCRVGSVKSGTVVWGSQAACLSVFGLLHSCHWWLFAVDLRASCAMGWTTLTGLGELGTRQWHLILYCCWSREASVNQTGLSQISNVCSQAPPLHTLLGISRNPLVCVIRSDYGLNNLSRSLTVSGSQISEVLDTMTFFLDWYW